MTLANGLILVLLHFESYLVPEKGHKLGIAINCICLLSLSGSSPQDNVNPLFSQFLQAYHQPLHAEKGTGLWVEYNNQ